MIVSWRPDPGDTYVDVFSITWETNKQKEKKLKNCYAFPLFSLISHGLYEKARVEAEVINDCFLLAYPAMYGADSRCAKDTSTATEHAQNAREREARPLIKKMFPKQLIRESLEV